MEFLVMSDLHGNVQALDALDAEFKKADAVLFGGDYAQFQHPETGLPALEKLCSKHEAIFGVLGNCDEPEFVAQAESRDCSVQGSLVFHEGLAFAGSGGGTKFTGTTPFERTEDEIMADLSLVSRSSQSEWGNLVVIAHNPPKDTLCDQVTGGVHVGSAQLRAFVEQVQPLALITGHIHESAAIDRIGRTVVINPGALLDGKYGWLTVQEQDGAWTVTDARLLSL